MLAAPAPVGVEVKLEKGPNIKPLPKLVPLADKINAPVVLKVGDNISTDTILPAGENVLPFRSNIPKISEFVFEQLDPTFHQRALQYQQQGSIIVAGNNYGQGSSREHAALAPRYLGIQAVIAKGFARIHAQNLVNFGILPLLFIDANDYNKIDQGDILLIADIHAAIKNDQHQLTITNQTKKLTFAVQHNLSDRQIAILLLGSLINTVKHS
jgi:aconitate hydratase